MGDVILDSDWLPSRQSIKIWSRKPTQCIKIGNACIKIWNREPTQCIKIGNACIKIWSRKSTQCVNICNACIKIWSREPKAESRIGNACIEIGDACIKIGNSCRRLPPVTAWYTPSITTGRTQSHKAMLCPYLKTKITKLRSITSLDKLPPPHFYDIYLYINIHIYNPMYIYMSRYLFHYCTKSIRIAKKLVSLRERS